MILTYGKYMYLHTLQFEYKLLVLRSPGITRSENACTYISVSITSKCQCMQRYCIMMVSWYDLMLYEYSQPLCYGASSLKRLARGHDGFDYAKELISFLKFP